MDETLKIESLHTSFISDYGSTKVLDDVSLSIKQSEVLALVGESGSGKTVTSLSIMGLLPPNGKIDQGKITLLSKKNEELDILKLSESKFNKVRGNDVSMIFQEPMTCLNPTMTIGSQIKEVILNHKKISNKDAYKSMIDLLKLVEIPEPEQRAEEYPHQLSGGMRQRIMISIALACEPKLIIADEPTTALDVTIQAQLLELLKRLKNSVVNKTSILFVTHNLGIVREIADRIIVMYAGTIVEEGTVDEVFNKPLHPYTKGLIQSLPEFNIEHNKKIQPIRGSIPNMNKLPSGCYFHPRCDFATENCKINKPNLEIIVNDRKSRCFEFRKLM
jgi:oligopeptide/dipeptide ABC transporter ATP-binding protein